MREDIKAILDEMTDKTARKALEGAAVVKRSTGSAYPCFPFRSDTVFFDGPNKSIEGNSFLRALDILEGRSNGE